MRWLKVGKASTLASVAVLGVIGVALYWLYQKLKDWNWNIPWPTIPTIPMPTLPTITLPKLPTTRELMEQALGPGLPESYYVMTSVTPEQASPESIIYQPEEYAKELQQYLQTITQMPTAEEVLTPTQLEIYKQAEQAPPTYTEYYAPAEPTIPEVLPSDVNVNPWTGELSYLINGTWIPQSLIGQLSAAYYQQSYE